MAKYASRPISTCYSKDTSVRTNANNASRISRSSTITRAIGKATLRIEDRQWNRADVYNQWGAHIRSIVRFPHRGIAIEEVNVPLHINSDRQQRNHVKQGNPGPRGTRESRSNVLIALKDWRKRG